MDRNDEIRWKADRKRERRQIVGEGARWLPYSIIALLVIVFAIGGVSMLAYGTFLPWRIGIERTVVQASRQYTESKVHLLEQLHTQALALDTEIAESADADVKAAKQAQLAGNVRRMKSEVALIPATEVPVHISAFLSRR